MAYPCVLIPAYKPNEQMIQLVKSLRELNFNQIVVVDDGSGPEYMPVFESAAAEGCVVLHHAINMGKGRALKTGINQCLTDGLSKNGIITADADGQHTPQDIIKIADAMKENSDVLVLGVRDFTGKVPLKSRFGNQLTRKLFYLINGKDVRDTQTGLRGLPAKHLELMLSFSGERYEYEMNVLLSARLNAIDIVQISIETIYIEKNSSSHFHAIFDSFRIYRLIFKFIFSSLFATGIDYLLFALVGLLYPNQIIVSVVVARICSSFVNYTINRNLVFKQKNQSSHSILKYYILAVVIMFCSYGLIKVFNGYLGLHTIVAKLISDTLLYFLSFFVQREFIFRAKTPKQPVDDGVKL